MSRLFPDTHPEMEKLQIDLWCQATPARKMEMLAQLYRSARFNALAGLERRYPKAAEAELKRRLADLRLSGDLVHSLIWWGFGLKTVIAYGWRALRMRRQFRRVLD